MPRDLLAQPNNAPRNLLTPPSTPVPSENPVLGFAKGAAKGLGSTAYGIETIGETVANATGLNKLTQLLYGYTPEQNALGPKPEILTPRTTAQRAGFGVEQIAELLIPGPGEAAAVAKAAKYGKAAALGAKAAVGALDFGARTALQTGGDARKTAESALAGGIAPPAIAGAGKVLSKVLPPIGRTAAAMIGTMIGKEPEHIVRAFQNPVAVARGMANRVIPLDVREKAVSALKNFSAKYGDEFAKGLESLQKQYGKEIPQSAKDTIVQVLRPTADHTLELTERSKAAENLPRLFRKYAVSVTKNGLNFDTLNSAIVKPGEKTNLKTAYETITNQKDFSPVGVQRVAARLRALTKFADGATTQSSAIVGEMHSLYDKLVKKAYPELGQLRDNYAASSKIASEIDSVLRSVANQKASIPAVTTAVKKLSNLFSEDNEAYLKAIQTLEKVSGVDLLNDLAASEFRNVLPRSLGSKLGQGALLAGGVFNNPLLLLTLPLFSPRLQGKLVTAAGKALPKVEKAAPKLINAAVRIGTRASQNQ